MLKATMNCCAWVKIAALPTSVEQDGKVITLRESKENVSSVHVTQPSLKFH